MDIVDKVFEGLSLNEQADKARRITAHQRKKELRKRQYTRILALGSVAAVIVGLITTGVIINLPKGTSAESEIEVSFPETENSDENKQEEPAQEPAQEPAKAEEAPAPVKTTTKKGSTTKKTSTPSTTASQTTAIKIDSNAEKTDQGTTGGNGCTEYAENALYCKDTKTPEQPTTPSPSEEEKQSGDSDEGDVDQKDSGAADGKTD